MSSFKRLSAKLVGRDHAFTLIELLVVIAIIGILAAILLPVLQKAKQRSWDAGCVNNKHEIQMAYIMYSDDNDNKLVGNSVGTDKPIGWVTGYLDWTAGPNSPNTNIAYLNAGLLGQYTSQTIGCYQCPADIYVSAPQRAKGWSHRIRSVRVNGYLDRTPVDTDWTKYGAGIGANFDILKATDIKSPSSMWVFIDSHPDTGGTNGLPTPYDGMFSLPPANVIGNSEWGDMPASYHDGNSCGFSFEDGHAEIHRWIDGTTINPVNYTGPLAGIRVSGRYNQDLMWTFHHAYNTGIN